MVNADVQSSLMLFDKTIKTDYGTTYGAANTLAGTATRALRMPRINKNASDKRAIVDATGFPPSFTSTSRAEFHSEASAAARAYVRERPCYDRVSSCKTNYTLGKEPLVTRTTNDDLLAHPRTRPRAVQSEIGGWKRADGSYKKLQESIDSIRRGGGGGEGCLGISFNVVTGAEVPGIREHRRAIAGARRTQNITAYHKHTDSYNVVTNRDVPAAPPPRMTAASLLRNDTISMRTRPW